MRLERLPEYVTITVVTALGIAFAVFAGRYAGSGQLGLIFTLLSAVAALAIAVTLRKAVWMLVPVAWILEGQIPLLPIPFAVRDILIGMVFGSYCAFVSLKIVRVRPKIGTLDVLVFANLLYLAITFLRNPVGVDALGSDRVGGRPYFYVFIAVLGYLVLRRVVPSRRELMAFPWIITGMTFIVGALNLLAYLVPWTAPIMGSFYTGISQDEYNNTSSFGGDAADKGRLNQLSSFGITATGLLCSLYRPSTLLMPWLPVRFIIFMASMLAVAFSGHRSALLSVMIFFVLASYYRGRIRDSINLALVGLMMILLVILAQGRVIEFPFAIQRTLSWLPGEWNHEAVADARYSTNWRLEMWKVALTDPTYLENKLLGDGFGFTKHDLAIISTAQGAMNSGMAPMVTSQEIALRSGNFHSGPITTLKVVGAVGSALYYLLIFCMAHYAHRLVLRAKETPYFTTALFLCIPVVSFPFTFIVIFGAFDGAFPYTIMSLGFLQVLDRGIGTSGTEQEMQPSRPVRESSPRSQRYPALVRPKFTPSALAIFENR